MKRPFPILVPALLAVVVSGCGSDVTGPATALFSCVFGEPFTVAPGEVLQVRGAANRTVCIAQNGAPAGEFVYIPFFGTPAPAQDDPAVTLEVELEVLGGRSAPGGSASSVEVGGPVLLTDPTGSVGARAVEGPVSDRRFHDWLRRREIRELTPLIRSAPDGGAAAVSRRDEGAATVPRVGELRTFNVAISCTAEDLRTGEVVYVSERAVVVTDTANPAEMTPEDHAHFALTFDTLVYPVATAHFGVPTDIDNNDRTILFFTRAVNELTPRTASAVTIGFFWSGDLFPAEETSRLQGCPAANQAEMFYLIAPDPRGIAGREFPLDKLRERAIPLIGHEFQHLINASRRLFVNDAVAFEEPWLNEGLSHIAEELLFYSASGLEPSMNLTGPKIRATPNGVAAFNEFMSGNLTNFHRYLSRPDTASLMGIDNLSTRGATWAFLRYAADRSGAGDRGFFYDLVNSRVAGLDNLRERLGADDPVDWMRDWTVSVYADDFVPGIAARFTNPSWDLRSVFEATDVGTYPLAVRSLQSESPVRIELQAGGAVYARFSVAPGARAVLNVEAAGGAPPATLRGSFLRVP